MSRADAATRIVRAAITLGATKGVGAMSLQGIAAAAGVSKALLLYHFRGKAALRDAVVDALGRASAERLRLAARATDAMHAWRALVRDETVQGEVALLGALALEADVAAEPLQRARAEREDAAVALATAVLGGLQLMPRVPAEFVGRLLLRQLDGLAAAATRDGVSVDALEAELDVFALALLSLGR
ncbi:MAG: TetR/AcrR family transcriptional regulator [Gemmatimonadetes bacterium]|nr:TetR/AcrR family transcriptional regulator [Gemmatimonadota bacterium]